jgi:hypothetical protein
VSGGGRWVRGLEDLEIDAAGENGLGDLTRLASLGFEVWIVDNV